MENIDKFNSMITSIVPVGAIVGVIFGSKLATIGRRKSIIILDIIWATASIITTIRNFYILMIGRAIIGFTSGAFSVIVPLFVSEIAPVSISGTLGGINQFMIAFSIMIAGVLGFYVPLKGDVYLRKYSNIWIYIFLVPVILSLLQWALLLFVFKYDTPAFYTKMNQKELFHSVNKLIYKGYNSNSNTNSSSVIAKEEKYSDLFSYPYFKAFAIGWSLSFMQGLTGINWILFYSTDIFSKNATGSNPEVAAKYGTFLFGLVNWSSCILALPLLGMFGRKKLLLVGQYGMILCHFCLSLWSKSHIRYSTEFFVLLFVSFYEIGVGTILWIYASEIMTAKGLGIAALFNWISTIVFSFITPYLYSMLPTEYVYGLLMIFWIIGLIFIHCKLFLFNTIVFIVETKGLTKSQIDEKINGYTIMKDDDSPESLDMDDLGIKKQK